MKYWLNNIQKDEHIRRAHSDNLEEIMTVAKVMSRDNDYSDPLMIGVMENIIEGEECKLIAIVYNNTIYLPKE